MTVTSGWSAAIGFNRSRVGPHCWVAQNFGVANATTNGFPAATASAIDVS